MSDGAGRPRPANAGRPAPAAVPPLHVVTPPEVAARDDFAERVGALQRAAGARVAVHLRMHGAEGRQWYRAARIVEGGADRHGGWLVVNDRVDVALTTGADAVQLGGRSMPVGTARRLVGEGTRIGRSVHGADGALRAAERGANYLVLGTIFPTPTHPDREAAGPGLVAECRGIGLPVVAIGGIDAGRVAEVRRAGAAGIAVVRAVWERPNPARAARRLLRAWDAASPDVDDGGSSGEPTERATER